MARTYSYWPLAVLLAVVIVSAGALGAYVYEAAKLPPNHGLLTVQVGDNVTVNYIGSFGTGPQNGTVFDTSFWSVANNTNIPKSLQFTNRGAPSDYTPLGVHVSGNTPSGGYVFDNITFDGVVTGFWQGLVGMTGNVSKVVSIPPALGYGNPSPACYQTVPLVSTVSAQNRISTTDFSTNYPTVTAATGIQFTDPQYGWTDLIVSANASWVVVQYVPTLGQVTHPYGYAEAVTNITSAGGGAGTITLSTQLVPSQAGRVGGTLPSTAPTVCDSNQFIVTTINPATNTMVWNFNPEIEGQTIVFTVTIVDIYPGPYHHS